MNDLLLELIGVFGSGHELTPHLSREETLPKSRGPRSLQTRVSAKSVAAMPLNFDYEQRQSVEERVRSLPLGSWLAGPVL